MRHACMHRCIYDPRRPSLPLSQNRVTEGRLSADFSSKKAALPCITISCYRALCEGHETCEVCDTHVCDKRDERQQYDGSVPTLLPPGAVLVGTHTAPWHLCSNFRVAFASLKRLSAWAWRIFSHVPHARRNRTVVVYAGWHRTVVVSAGWHPSHIAAAA